MSELEPAGPAPTDVVVVARVADLPAPVVLTSTTVACSACGAECWISPASRRRLGMATCVQCSADLIRQWMEAGWPVDVTILVPPR